MPHLHRFHRKVWSYVVLYGLLVAGFGLVVWKWEGSSSPHHTGPSGIVRALAHPKTTHLRVAGSGSNLPLTRRLIQGFFQQFPRHHNKIQLFPSIGTSGGIQAVLDGIIHLGLTSRPLKPAEMMAGLTVFSYARVPVVVAVHRAVPIKDMTEPLLYRIYRGLHTRWPPTLPVVVLQREQGDSSHEAIYRHLPTFAAINKRAYQQQQWQVIYRDQQMQDALLQTPGAIGIFDYGAIISQRLPIRILSWHGITPSPQHVQTQRYPFYKDLSFVYQVRTCQRFEVCRHFLSFVRSKAGQAVIETHGYIAQFAYRTR